MKERKLYDEVFSISMSWIQLTCSLMFLMSGRIRWRSTVNCQGLSELSLFCKDMGYQGVKDPGKVDKLFLATPARFPFTTHDIHCHLHTWITPGPSRVDQRAMVSGLSVSDCFSVVWWVLNSAIGASLIREEACLLSWMQNSLWGMIRSGLERDSDKVRRPSISHQLRKMLWQISPEFPFPFPLGERKSVKMSEGIGFPMRPVASNRNVASIKDFPSC